MGFQSTQQRYRAKPPATPIIKPYYGLSPLEIATESMVLSLTGRGPTAGVIDSTVTLTALSGSGNYMYFAYPADYGTARFFDTDNSMYGGWDGANNDPFNIYGPAILNVTINSVEVPFYVYRTDYPELGLCHWVVSKEPEV